MYRFRKLPANVVVVVIVAAPAANTIATAHIILFDFGMGSVHFLCVPVDTFFFLLFLVYIKSSNACVCVKPREENFFLSLNICWSAKWIGAGNDWRWRWTLFYNIVVVVIVRVVFSSSSLLILFDCLSVCPAMMIGDDHFHHPDNQTLLLFVSHVRKNSPFFARIISVYVMARQKKKIWRQR